MVIKKRDIWLLTLTLCIAGATAVAALQNRTVASIGLSAQDEERGQWPIADPNATLPTDSKEKDQRIKRNKRHRFAAAFIGPGSETVLFYHWPPGLPALPASQSDVIVIGQVLEAKAYLSDDKNGVYSEAVLRVDQILKNNSPQPPTLSNTIIAERNGGRVQYPTGKIGGLYYSGLGIPRRGRQYVLFLKSLDDDGYYHLITGYELRGGKVFPIDRTTSSDTNFDAYVNADEANFLKEVQSAITNSSQPLPQ